MKAELEFFFHEMAEWWIEMRKFCRTKISHCIYKKKCVRFVRIYALKTTFIQKKMKLGFIVFPVQFIFIVVNIACLCLHFRYLIKSYRTFHLFFIFCRPRSGNVMYRFRILVHFQAFQLQNDFPIYIWTMIQIVWDSKQEWYEWKKWKFNGFFYSNSNCGKREFVFASKLNFHILM